MRGQVDEGGAWHSHEVWTPAQVHPLLKQFAAVGRVLTADIAIGHGSFGFAACCALLSLSTVSISSCAHLSNHLFCLS